MEVLVAKEDLAKVGSVGKEDLVGKVELAKVEVFDNTALVSNLLFLPPLTREPGSDLLKRKENKIDSKVLLQGPVSSLRDEKQK